MDELDDVDLPYKEFDAKNLFVRDDKKNNYYLITVKVDKRVDLKEFRKKYHTKHLSFAKEEELLSILNLTSGSVSPLGLLNDKEKKTIFFIENYFEDNSLIGIHPNDNTATIWLKAKDLITIIEEQGNQVSRVDIY
ncbi:ybaK/proline--tRNA ligase associated domain protein [Clostridium sp. CAG:451]|nr:ybaK/proline--tRNA ligase associated domain protein [Clostridium sp. CAG:451]